MNEELRKKVSEYFENLDDDELSPLYFYNYESTKYEFDPDKYSVEDMIRRVLLLSDDHASYNKDTKGFDTSSCRWRSSGDIWRHIIFYYPNVTIFDVLHGLYNIRNECGGHYCFDVGKRVFRLKSAPFSIRHGSADWYNNGPETSSAILADEYGIYFKDWEDI